MRSDKEKSDDGGDATAPHTSLAPATWPIADEAVREALLAAFHNGSWGRYDGPNVERLTNALAEFHQVPYVLPCCSGTFAVELALRGLGIEAGDEVLLAGYDFPGNFRSIEVVGARPVLADVRLRGWSLDLDSLVAAAGPQTRAILVSHLHGELANMRALRQIANDRGWWIVEDACQATGAWVQGKRAGTWGDVGVLSFGGSKLLTAGRGGAIITKRADIAQRSKIFCERGNHSFPLSELQAAVLLPQLEQLDNRNQRRWENVKLLLQELHGIDRLQPLAIPGTEKLAVPTADINLPSFYKLGFQLVTNDTLPSQRESFVTAFRAENIPLDEGFRGFAERSERRCRKPCPLPNSQKAAAKTLVLHHPILLESTDTIQRLGRAIRQVMAQ